MAGDKLKLFAVTAPGLKPFAIRELADLGCFPLTSDSNRPALSGPPGESEAGGVEFEGSLIELYRANLHMRTASRVLLRLDEFYAAAFAELRKKAARLPWEKYIMPGAPVTLRVTCHKSRLYHSGGVAERVAGAIADRLGYPILVQPFDENTETNPPQLVVVRLVRDLCTISLDSSGAALHRRGYRKATAKAPIRETLAAGMLLAAGWDKKSPLIDPFCGSGTIPIEAAMLACNIPPGRARRFSFMDWPGFDQRSWQALLQEAEAGVYNEPPAIKGSDRDAGAIVAAQTNAGRAGVADAIEFSRRAVSDIQPEGTGWIVTNPPYGVRVSSGKDLRNLYAQLGNILHAGCPGWRVAIISSQEQLLNSIGLRFETKISMVNGGVNVKLALGQVK